MIFNYIRLLTIKIFEWLFEIFQVSSLGYAFLQGESPTVYSRTAHNFKQTETIFCISVIHPPAEKESDALIKMGSLKRRQIKQLV